MILHVVGDGRGRAELEELARRLGVEQSVVFWGIATGERLDQIFDQTDLAIGSLGRHRSGVTAIQTLKNREYCARGLPFVYSESDPDFDNEPFVLRVAADETPLDIARLKAFVFNGDFRPAHIREFAERTFDWGEEMSRVMRSVGAGR